jgi:threonine/homoserine/homoserine lactone efflux protein
VTPDLFLRGLAIGFAVAFALGPIGLLVIRRTIERGWTYGFLSGAGVATADAVYAAIAAFGLTTLAGLLTGIDRPLGIVGGTVLLLLAARALRATGRADETPAQRAGERAGETRFASSAGGWASMVALTLTNPAAILSFAALFAALGAGSAGATGAVAVVAGVFTGSVAWWALLTALVARLRTRLTPRVIRAFNVLSALLIAGFGLAAIALGLAG